MFIGVISDTHGVLPEEVKNFLAPVDEVWHAGDFGGGAEFAGRIRLELSGGDNEAERDAASGAELPLQRDIAGGAELPARGDAGDSAEQKPAPRKHKVFRAVSGNCDGQDLRRDYPESLFFEVEGLKVLMTHIGGYPGHYDLRAEALINRYKPDIFVCGHSHILKVMNDARRNMLTINPGACGNQGWHVLRTALRFHIDKGKIHDMEVLNLPRN